MCDIINSSFKALGFCEMDSCNANMRNYNMRNKYWKNSTCTRSNYQYRIDKSNADVESGITEASQITFNSDIGNNSSIKNSSIENVSSNNHNNPTGYAKKSRPKHLLLNKSFDNRHLAKSIPKSEPTGEIVRQNCEIVERELDSLQTTPTLDHKAVESSQARRQSYTSDYLLGLRIIPPSLEKPKNLPSIPGIILCQPVLSLADQAPPTPLSPLSPPSFVLPSTKRLPNKAAKSSSNQKKKKAEPTRRVINLNLSLEVRLHTSINAWKAASVAKSTEEVGCDVKEMCNKLLGLLNKLSPLNFDGIANQIARLRVKDEEVMKVFINTIFEKAVIEPNFSELYAALSKRFSQWAVPSSHGSSRFVTFKDLMITRCQHEFEKDKYGEHDCDPSTIASPIEQKCEGDSDFSKKKRTLGNIRFIGELFMQDMLQEVVIHQCIVDLLKYRHDEDRLESLCKLLTVVGRKIDFIRSKPRIDQYFHRIRDIFFGRNISSRLRFMLRDILELRENNWMPRHLTSKPPFLRQSSLSTNMTGLNNHNNVPQLKKSISNDDSKLFNTLPRSFSYSNKQQQQQTAKLVDVRDVKCMKSKDHKSHLSFMSTEVNNNNKSLTATTTTNLISTPRSKRNDPISKNDNLHELLSANQIERKCATFLDEYLNINDLEEASLFFGEMNRSISKCCEILITLSLEKNFADRSKLGDLFNFALINKHVTRELFVKSTIGILNISDDLEIDIPKFWEYLAEIFYKIFFINPMDVTTEMFSESSGQESDQFDKLMKLFCDVLRVMSNKKSPKDAANLYLHVIKINFKFHINDRHVSELIDECEVGYKERLHEVVMVEDWFPESKIRSLEEEVLNDEGLGFVREVVALVAREVTSGEPPTVDTEKLKKSCAYLKRLNDRRDCGLEVLNAVQDFVFGINHPYGVLRSFFDVFYDEDVVSDETFDKWYNYDDDVPGRGVAKESIRKFFEWLHQSDDDDDDD